jgi:hypothetical protein
MMFGNMEYMVENRDQMQRMADEYNALRNAMGRAPTEQELGFFLENRMMNVDGQRMMYPDVNERALGLRDQMRSLEQRSARPQDYTGAAGMDAMSRSAGGIEGLMRYNQMMRSMMPRGVR